MNEASATTDRKTVPAPKGDFELAAFETAIRKSGEWRARIDNLKTLLSTEVTS
jgi:hypothetical protein